MMKVFIDIAQNTFTVINGLVKLLFLDTVGDFSPSKSLE